MTLKKYQSEILLLITAMIWGFAFVAQSSSMEHIGPFLFNGIRFILGATSLIPVMIWFKRRHRQKATIDVHSFFDRTHIVGGLLMGIILFTAASLQQIGIIYTSVANAGFITSLYIILVPLIGLFIGQKTYINVWFGAILALIGLYLLTVKGDLSIAYGDLLQLIGALFWALHIIVISKFSPKADAIKLSIIQFYLCGFLSFSIGLVLENFDIESILRVLPEILYVGILSTSVAYTLQVVAQKKVAPANAAIIFSLEAVFALLGGWILLQESLHMKGLIGCFLMFIGVLISQKIVRSTPASSVKQ
ncbi:MAG: DMT family transporter [Arenicella sp.]